MAREPWFFADYLAVLSAVFVAFVGDLILLTAADKFSLGLLKLLRVSLTLVPVLVKRATVCATVSLGAALAARSTAIAAATCGAACDVPP